MMYFDYPPKHSQSGTGTVYNDYMNHCSNWRTYLVRGSKSGSAHEATHCSNAQIRNADKSGRKVNGFYVGNNKAVVLEEPKIKKSWVAPYIPKEIREYRFSTYITGQRAWDNEPLYIVDELVCYCAGTETSLDQIARGEKLEWTDVALGPLEFAGYTAAMCLTVEEKDNEYWNREPNAIPVLRDQIKRGIDLFNKAKKDFPWDKQDRIYDALCTGNPCQKIRQFLKTRFNYVIGKEQEIPPSIFGF